MQIPEKRRNYNKRPDENPQESQTLFPQAKAMNLDKDNSEGFKPNVENTVNECNVEIETEKNGFREGEWEWSDESHVDYILPRHFIAFDFGFTFQIADFAEFCETSSSAVKDVGGAGFWEEDD